ncbi:MAG: methyltransferase domain-containing protein [Flavobacteriaceae bacterium]
MLGKLASRSTEREIMDDFQGDGATLESVLNDISRVNRILGGNRITINAVARLMEAHPQQKYTIIDVGCADGAMLKEIANYCRSQKIPVDLIGIDLNVDALYLAKKALVDYPEIRFLQQDVLQLEKFHLNCDILTTTLMIHHFTDSQLTVLLKQFTQLAHIGVVINDLHRSRMAFYLFELFSLVFLKTETARIDGLISIRKGFKKKDFVRFSEQLSDFHHSIGWKWAFRYLWIMQAQSPRTL